MAECAAEDCSLKATEPATWNESLIKWCPAHKQLFRAVAAKKTRSYSANTRQRQQLAKEKAKFVAQTVADAGALDREQVAERIREVESSPHVQDAIDLAVANDWLTITDDEVYLPGMKPQHFSRKRTREDRAIIAAHQIHNADEPVSRNAAAKHQEVSSSALQYPLRHALDQGWIKRLSGYLYAPGEVDPPALPAD